NLNKCSHQYFPIHSFALIPISNVLSTCLTADDSVISISQFSSDASINVCEAYFSASSLHSANRSNILSALAVNFTFTLHFSITLPHIFSYMLTRKNIDHCLLADELNMRISHHYELLYQQEILSIYNYLDILSYVVISQHCSNRSLFLWFLFSSHTPIFLTSFTPECKSITFFCSANMIKPISSFSIILFINIMA